MGSLPTKTLTFSGDALGDVLMCACKVVVITSYESEAISGIQVLHAFNLIEQASGPRNPRGVNNVIIKKFLSRVVTYSHLQCVCKSVCVCEPSE